MNTINLRGEQLYKSNILYPYGKINESFYNSDRIRITRAERITLYSDEGKRYLDAISGLWNNPLGYSDPSIVNAIREQSERICGCSLFDYTYEQAEENAGRILMLHDTFFSKICYTCSGSEAVDLAVKIARKICAVKGLMKKKKIVSFNGSYHGTTYGALSISGEEEKAFLEVGPGIGDTLKIPALYGEGASAESGTVLEWLEEQADLIAGFVVEPILLSDGIADLSQSFLHKALEICRKRDIIVVVDEVATGFYRTGTPFCYQRYGIRPDVVCMSKAINAGFLPLGAVALSEDCVKILDDMFKEDFLHGSTQSGNPLAVAASNAALSAYEGLFADNSVVRRTARFARNVNDALAGKNIVHKVEVNGNLVLLRLSEDGEKPDFNSVVAYRSLLRKQGLLTYPAKSGILLLPMYITTDSEYDEMTDIIVSFFG